MVEKILQDGWIFCYYDSDRDKLLHTASNKCNLSFHEIGLDFSLPGVGEGNIAFMHAYT